MRSSSLLYLPVMSLPVVRGWRITAGRTGTRYRGHARISYLADILNILFPTSPRYACRFACCSSIRLYPVSTWFAFYLNDLMPWRQIRWGISRGLGVHSVIHCIQTCFVYADLVSLGGRFQELWPRCRRRACSCGDGAHGIRVGLL